MRRGVALLVLVAGLGAGTRAAAQAPEAAERARVLHQEGAAALLDARFAVARDLFREAMSLAPNGGSAFNLALSLRGTGESLEAIAMFERMLSGALGPVSEERTRDIERWIVEERGALAVIEVSIAGAPRASVRVDGVELGEIERSSPRRLRLDAGRRALSVRATGYGVVEQVLFAERATETRLTLTLEPMERAQSVFESVGFWVAAGAVLLAGVAVGVAVALGPYEEPAMSYEPFGVATALTLFGERAGD